VTVSAPGSLRELARTWHDGNPFRVMHSGALVASDPSLIGYGRRRWGDGRCSADLGGVPTAGSIVAMTGRQDPHRPGLLAWSARHLPWWVPMLLWYPVLLVTGVLSVTFLTAGLVGGVIAAIDLDGWTALRAIFSVGVGLSGAAWWLDEARQWRELTPTALRDGRRPVRHDRRATQRRHPLVEQFRRGYTEGRRGE
jgi:hypothetical protein